MNSLGDTGLAIPLEDYDIIEHPDVFVGTISLNIEFDAVGASNVLGESGINRYEDGGGCAAGQTFKIEKTSLILITVSNIDTAEISKIGIGFTVDNVIVEGDIKRNTCD